MGSNRYVGTQTEKNLLEAFQENHRQEISTLICIRCKERRI